VRGHGRERATVAAYGAGIGGSCGSGSIETLHDTNIYTVNRQQVQQSATYMLY
jgi:hypothetical protein